MKNALMQTKKKTIINHAKIAAISISALCLGMLPAYANESTNRQMPAIPPELTQVNSDGWKPCKHEQMKNGALISLPGKCKQSTSRWIFHGCVSGEECTFTSANKKITVSPSGPICPNPNPSVAKQEEPEPCE